MSITESLETLSKGNTAAISAQPPAITCTGSSEPAPRNEVHTQTPLPVVSHHHIHPHVSPSANGGFKKAKLPKSETGTPKAGNDTP